MTSDHTIMEYNVEMTNEEYREVIDKAVASIEKNKDLRYVSLVVTGIVKEMGYK